jgi:cytochrome c oxidase assembly protein subunit 15
MVALMVLIGGLTRLTNSGLSIVEWNPIHGVIPPLNESEWMEEFAKYQQSPEYLKINHGMLLDEFKSIFALEYIHRLVGRIAGAIFLLPLLFFAFKKHIPFALGKRLALIFALGLCQGVIGWYMVKSGLVDDPHVSHFRLALHLTFAFVIYGMLFWYGLEVQKPGTRTPLPGYRFSLALTALILLQTIFGAFVAGLDAGLVYNEFPKMGGVWIPQELYNSFSNVGLDGILHDPVSVQFLHRVIALIVTLTVLAFSIRHYRLRTPVYLLVLALFLQVGLGIATLTHEVPVALASAHQMGALLLFSIALFINRNMLYRPHSSAKP